MSLKKFVTIKESKLCIDDEMGKLKTSVRERQLHLQRIGIFSGKMS
jgi:hypothetical protein